jgi:CPA1 family monovalent cation:H+ antiporter
MLTASSAFALFLMLALASLTYYVSLKFKLPYTILLTFVGVLLVPISSIDPLAVLTDFELTPELLFYIFLPTLLFESAFNMNIRRVVDDLGPIMLLAVIGYLASSFFIGGALWWLLDVCGFGVPFVVTLLFGALISATDPVAVLALFKEFGAPRRLSLIFEGESLLNDATALALFLIVLGFLEHGITGGSLALGAVTFFVMLLGGALLGLVFGGGIAKLVGVYKNNEIVAVTLMIVCAHLTFLVAELANEHLAHEGLAYLKLSPIIATTAASLVMGNYGRFKVTPRAEAFVEKFWSQFAFMANSVVFILVGVLLASNLAQSLDLLIPIALAVIVVAVGRALSIYGTIIPYNAILKEEQRIPMAWQHLLSWGSLRGALAIMLVLLVPADLVLPGWMLAVSVRDFLLIITVACIFVTLFVKAPLVGPIIRRLNIDARTKLENTEYEEARAIIHATALIKLTEYAEKGYVGASVAKRLVKEHEERFHDAYEKSHSSGSGSHAGFAEKSLRLYLIGHEKEILKELLAFDEITEPVFKRIYGKLTIQGENIERGLPVDPSRCFDYRDIFEHMASWLRPLAKKPKAEDAIRADYLYYRAQEILAQKVLKELTLFETKFSKPMFGERALKKTRAEYEVFYVEAKEKRAELLKEHKETIDALDEELAFRSTFRVEEKILDRLFHRELLTQKLYVKLKEEYEDDVHHKRLRKEAP